MKHPKLLVRVACTTRKFYLHLPPKGRNDYHVRFTPPSFSSAPQLEISRTTGTMILPVAKERARKIIESFWRDSGDAAESLKQRSNYSTLGEVLEAYRPLVRDVKPETRGKNKRALLLVVRESLGVEDPESLRADVWATGKMVRDFQRKRLQLAESRDEIEQERAAKTINSTLLQARSVLSARVMECYSDLKLPDLTEFRKVALLRVDATSAYVPLPAACVEAIERTAAFLKADQPLVYRAYFFMSRFGLRNSEVVASRRNWIERRSDGTAELVITRRPDFKTKNRKYRRIDIDRGTLGEIDAMLGPGTPDAWILDAPMITDRSKIVNRELNAWLRPMLPPDRVKCAYELRKYAASVIADRPASEGGGIQSAADFLGDTIAVTEKHYRGQMRRVGSVRQNELTRVA